MSAPLTGLRVVSMALNVPGPVAVARLAAEGASVTKIEPPDGDPLARYSRDWYDRLHQGVEVVTVDLKTAAGVHDVARRLTVADVFITAQRPAALARLGLAPGALAAAHPHLRIVNIVGDAAAPDTPGHDVTYQAEAGLLRGRLPVTFLADLAGAERVVSAVLLGLREPPGGRRVVGLRDALDDFAAPLRHGLTTDGGRFGGADPAYAVYRTADGSVAVAALEPHFRARLYSVLALPLDAPLGDVMAARTNAEWTAIAAAHDLPLSVIRTGA